MFTMRFDFQDHDTADISSVNAALSGMRLSHLKVEDSDGYLAVCTSYDQDQRPAGTTYRYGFDHLSLACETEGDDLHTWQIDAQAYPKGELSGSDAFHDLWCRAHPDRVIRVLVQYGFDNADAFVVLYHERMNQR